jgi:dihydrolipoamide dehydrogenase
MDYDYLVIGSGPGGYMSAIRAAQLGAKVALVEKKELGGACLNYGCIPTKSLLAASEKFFELKKCNFVGISVSNIEVDFSLMVEEKNKLVTSMREGLRNLIISNNVEIFKGSAKFIDRHNVEISQDETIQLKANTIVIATGASPTKIALPGDNRRVLYSNDILNLSELPESLVIIGGGVIGVEFATIFNNLGTKVTIVEIVRESYLKWIVKLQQLYIVSCKRTELQF